MTDRVIIKFSGAYRFLSNFYVEKDGKTTEHHFQAMKADNAADWKYVESSPTPGVAKRRGRRVTLRKDWEKIKLKIMEDVVRDKFEDPDLARHLLATGDAELQEGNDWGDTFWGVDLESGRGENRLGKILMKIRDELRDE